MAFDQPLLDQKARNFVVIAEDDMDREKVSSRCVFVDRSHPPKEVDDAFR
jgi:hypothetical protein